MSTYRDAIAEVLAEHGIESERYAHPGPGYFIECECGWLEVVPSQPGRRHRTHLADALLASEVIAGMLAEARDGGAA